jgi:hypothetical protein
MHPSLAHEPWKFFHRAWTRRSCFEAWDEGRQEQLTLRKGDAKSSRAMGIVEFL